MVKIWTEQGLQQGLQPQLEAALQQLPNMEIEKLEDLADALPGQSRLKVLEKINQMRYLV